MESPVLQSVNYLGLYLYPYSFGSFFALHFSRQVESLLQFFPQIYIWDYILCFVCYLYGNEIWHLSQAYTSFGRVVGGRRYINPTFNSRKGCRCWGKSIVHNQHWQRRRVVLLETNDQHEARLPKHAILILMRRYQFQIPLQSLLEPVFNYFTLISFELVDVW